jgi:hypothetical protein
MKRLFYTLAPLTLMALLLTACKGDKGDPGIPVPKDAQNLFDVGEVKVVLRDAYYADGTPVGGTPAPDTLVVKYNFERPYLEFKSPGEDYPPEVYANLVNSNFLDKLVMNMSFIEGISLANITRDDVYYIYLSVTHDIKTQGKIKRWQGEVFSYSGGQNVTIERLSYDPAKEMLSFKLTLTFDRVYSDPQSGNSRGTTADVSGNIRVLEVAYRP